MLYWADVLPRLVKFMIGVQDVLGVMSDLNVFEMVKLILVQDTCRRQQTMLARQKPMELFEKSRTFATLYRALQKNLECKFSEIRSSADVARPDTNNRVTMAL